MNTIGFEHGKQAFIDGAPLVPHFDAKVGYYIETHSHREIIKYLKDWQRGYIIAQLASEISNNNTTGETK